MSSTVSSKQLLDATPEIDLKQKRIVLDFPIVDENSQEIRSETGELLGFRFPEYNIENYDHHMPVDEMARIISTTPLVTKLVSEKGTFVTDQIVLNHLDTDSLLSGLVITGNLAHTDTRWNVAAIAADHTGQENEIADLLNAIEEKRDVDFSTMCLNNLLENRSQTSEVQALVTQYKQQRQEVVDLVHSGQIKDIGNNVYLAYTKDILRSEFFPSLIPNAAIFVIAGSSKDGYIYKVRLGQNAPKGIRVNELGVPHLSGRWNAGGTLRGGPVAIAPEEYAQLIKQKL